MLFGKAKEGNLVEPQHRSMDYCGTLRRVQRNHTEAWAEHIVYRIIRPNGLAILFHNKAAGRPHSGPAA
jgi:hypothetical protein